MKTLLQSLQNKLSEVSSLKYVDEDWGQLDYYSPNMPVQYPCCLIDIEQIEYTNLGKDFAKTPKNRQIGQVQIKITVAQIKLTNTSFQAPQTQKEEAWRLWDILEEIHQKLHGYSLLANVTPLIRGSQRRTLRDDGLQEYQVYYLCEVSNC